VNVSLGETTLKHLGVQMVHDPLDTANTGNSSLVNFIHPVVGDEVEQLRVEIVKALVRAQSGFAEGDQSTGRERILCGTLVTGSFVVVSDIVEDGVGCGSCKGSNLAWSGSALANKWWELLSRGKAVAIHGT